ncbi:hypothetical protein [Streptomyces caeruleatus]|nr:hypothetical protein [Streptomyces caeruleatus]
MHRTTTTATLLVTMAVSALAGCTTVEYPPPSGGPAVPSQPPAPRPSGSMEPEVVQAPAREALTLIETSPRPTPTTSAARPTSPTAPTPTPPAPRAHPHPRPEHREPRHPGPERPERPRVEVPDVSESVRKGVPGNPGSTGNPGQADVCSLGKKYGGWRPDSPESKICEQTYGH